ncbi:MAG: YkgJ family cysteine cluster protein [Deltaproteobacteria bacterium]|nr:MAG: YkgJ family cysteine cluster protein [Deltaproteobacteria bacterium]
MDAKIIPLSADKTFSFDCSPAVPCFNACCQDLVQALAPYDVLRLKNSLGLSSGQFLETYTSRHIGPETGLPIVSLRFESRNNRQCPFVTPAGCRVYADRPASCRLYPLARGTSRNRHSGRISELFALIREPHCCGFRQKTSWTARGWIRDQGLGPYNRFNDLLLELISLKNRLMPGPLNPELEDLFYRALYDIDSLRGLVAHRCVKEGRDCDPADPATLAADEIERLRWAHGFVKKTVFGKAANRKG